MPRAKRGRSQVFVGSSRESRRLAYAIQQNLDQDADITVWDQNVFKLTKTTIENLLERLAASDFGVFVFSPDDVLKLRKKTLKAVRDNIVFELGLFMGRLGRERVFVLTPHGSGSLRMPTDLSGVTVGRFNAKRKDQNWRAAVGPFCSDVREQLEKLGPLKRSRPANVGRKRPRASTPRANPRGPLAVIEALYGARDHRVNVARMLNDLVRNGRLSAYVGNQLGGDPCPNTPKDLQVVYTYKGKTQTVTVPEGGDLRLPVQAG